MKCTVPPAAVVLASDLPPAAGALVAAEAHPATSRAPADTAMTNADASRLMCIMATTLRTSTGYRQPATAHLALGDCPQRRDRPFRHPCSRSVTVAGCQDRAKRSAFAQAYYSPCCRSRPW